MSVNYTNAVKNGLGDYLISQMGTTSVLEICTAGYGTILATIPFNSTPAPSPTAGVITFSGFPKTATPANAGTAALARIRTATGGTTLWDGLTVGTTGTDIVLASTALTTTTNSLTINSATHTIN